MFNVSFLRSSGHPRRYGGPRSAALSVIPRTAFAFPTRERFSNWPANATIIADYEATIDAYRQYVQQDPGACVDIALGLPQRWRGRFRRPRSNPFVPRAD